MFLRIVQTLCLLLPCIPKNPEVKVVNEIDTNFKRVGRSWDLNENEIPSMNTDKSPLILTHDGWVEGFYQRAMLGRAIASFQGIPYAQPPVGALRFKDPQPILPWNGVLKTVEKPPMCLQLDMAQFMRLRGKENCLYLNIYSPMIPEKYGKKQKRLPVMIFIHGGGFLSGYSADFGPAYLLNKDVVLVTINYRLGPLGFLSSGDEYGSGNWGMKDQVLAMKWVKKNIHTFGGDPNKITLFGVSAGAASVGLHILSKQTDGLFHAAICQSGSSLANAAIQNTTVGNSLKVAALLECPNKNSKNMMSCLRQRDAKQIVEALANSMESWKVGLVSRLHWGPIVELPSPTAFLDEAPEVGYAVGRAKKVPMIIGANQDEGAIFSLTIALPPGTIQIFNSNWDKAASFALDFDTRTNETSRISKWIKEFYLEGKDMTLLNRGKWMQMLGDRMIVNGVHSVMKLHSKIAPTFGYYFNYKGENSLIGALDFANRFSGNLFPRRYSPTHGDELIYLLNSTSFPPLKYGTQDFAVSEFLVNLWTNFAETGKPLYTEENGRKLPIWIPISNKNEAIKVLEINENPKVKLFPREVEKRMRFWDTLNLP